MLLLSGCGFASESVDVMTTPPDGLWQTLAVWPLAKSLIWLDGIMAGQGITYHWGFAIIAFTIIIKVITFPLTLTQIRGMEAQKAIQPKVQELQKKYGNDREKLSKAQMELYQEAGVNPLSGCLPLIIQMPILFGLYQSIVVLGNRLADARFYWIPDLGFPRYTEGLAWITTAYNGGEYGTLVAYMVLPVLLVVSQFIMQKWMTPSAGGDQAGMTKQIGLMMTFMFGFFTLQVPAGLSLYWVTSNLLQVLQQWLITSGRLSLFGSGAAAAAGAAPVTIDGAVVESDAHVNGSSSTATTNKSDTGNSNNSSSRSNRTKRRKAKKKR